MATVSTVLTAGRRAIADLESQLIASLVDQYEVAWRQVERRLADVETMIEAAVARGETVDPAWLLRQQWWQATTESIELEMQRYTSTMAQQMSTGQLLAVQTSHQVSATLADFLTQQAMKRGVSVGAGIVARIDPGAFERWVIAQQPDSPIRKAIDRYGERVSESVRTRMTEGLAAGESPRTITNRIVSDVGDKAIRGRMNTLTKSEMFRAYRGSLRDSMESFGSDVITGWRWVSRLSRRTCAACLAMHGREFPYDQYQDLFHAGCSCHTQPIVSTDILPRRAPGKTGEAWLREQPAAVQRHILQTKERYEAFRTGTPLGDFMEVKSDETWGDSIAVKPMRRRR